MNITGALYLPTADSSISHNGIAEPIGLHPAHRRKDPVFNGGANFSTAIALERAPNR